MTTGIMDVFSSEEDEEDEEKAGEGKKTKSLPQVMMPNPLVLSSDEEEAADELGQRHARTYNKKGHNRKVEEVTYP